MHRRLELSHVSIWAAEMNRTARAAGASGENAMFRQAIVAVTVAVAVLAAFSSCVGPATAPRGAQDDEPHVGPATAPRGAQDDEPHVGPATSWGALRGVVQYGAWRHEIREDDFSGEVTESVTSLSQEENLLFTMFCQIDHGYPIYMIMLSQSGPGIGIFANGAVEIRFDDARVSSYDFIDENTALSSPLNSMGRNLATFMLLRLGVSRVRMSSAEVAGLSVLFGFRGDDWVAELMKIRVNRFVSGAQSAKRIVASFPVSGASRAIEAMQAPCGFGPP